MLSTIGRAAIRRVGAGASHAQQGRVGELTWQLQRVCIARSSYEASDAHSTRRSGVTYSTRRSYAAAAKSPGPPRAKKTTTKAKSTTTKKTASGSAKKATTRKAAKPKKKVAAKRPAKELTAEQVAKRAEVKAKAQIKELKAAALLSGPKTLPASAWAVVFAEDVKQKKSEMGTNFAGVTNIVKEAATRYKNLDSAEREHYNHLANQNKQANDAAYKKWVEGHTPDQIREANAARNRLKRIEGKANSQKFTLIEDSRIPKRAVPPRALFTKERWESGDLKGISFTEASKTLSQEWDSLSAAEKKHYEDMAAADKTRYAKEYKSTFHRDVPSPRAAATT